jgi:hypothetical protein
VAGRVFFNLRRGVHRLDGGAYEIRGFEPSQNARKKKLAGGGLLAKGIGIQLIIVSVHF